MSSSYSGNKNFWIAQAVGWAIFGLTNVTIQAILQMPAALVFFNTFFSMLVGILVTTIYRYLIRLVNWDGWRIRTLLLFIAGTTLLLALAWIALIALLFSLVSGEGGLTLGDLLANLVNGCLLFLIWNLIYFFFQYFSKYQLAELARWRSIAEVKEAQLGTLRAQINPHFVFNTLNNIRALIQEDTDKARSMLLNFSSLFRYSLKYSDEKEIRLEEEVQIIRQYLDLLSIQYEDRLQYSVEVEAHLPDQGIPPMMLQFLVENGIKHGIALLPEGGELRVYIRQVGAKIHLEVRNTGTLARQADVDARLGVGLQNIRERLSWRYKDQARLLLEEQAPMVIARIEIPIDV